MLVNAKTGKDIMELTDGAVVRLPSLDTRDLNVRAVTTSSGVRSVVLQLDEDAPRTDNGSPYSLFGDSDGKFKSGHLTAGSHTVTATPYSRSGGSGDAGSALSVTFTVTDRTLTGFVLVDADTDEDIMPLTDGTRLDLSMLPRHLNVRAETGGEEIGSVKFKLDGGYSRIENVEPFALFGNHGPDYLAGTLRTGKRTLTATPYRKDRAKGDKGPSLSVQLRIVRDADIESVATPLPNQTWSPFGEAPVEMLDRHQTDGLYPLDEQDRQAILDS
jgi:hypothetical protein